MLFKVFLTAFTIQFLKKIWQCMSKKQNFRTSFLKSQSRKDVKKKKSNNYYKATKREYADIE